MVRANTASNAAGVARRTRARASDAQVAVTSDVASAEPATPTVATAAANVLEASESESTEDMLRRYRRRQSMTLRDRVVERHRGLVEGMARMLASRLPPTVDAQDLVHAGMWGLMQAIATYEPERCDRFTAFMRIRVRGAMLDELRSMDYLPRLIRRRLRQCNDALVRLRATLHREPSRDELAAELGITTEALARWMANAGMKALGTGPDGDTDAFVDEIVDEDLESPIEPIARAELLQLVRAALQPVEWKVLQLLYLEGMTGKQAARRLRLSPSRVCQIHGRVLDRLKSQLAAVAI